MRILFITSFPPFPIDRTGGGIRSRLLIDALKKIGSVGIFYLNYRGADHDISHELSPLFADGSLMLEQSVKIGGQGKIYAHADKALRGLGMIWGRKLAAAGLRVDIGARKAIEDLVASKKYDLVVARLSRPTAVSGLLDVDNIPLIVDADDWEPSRVTTQLNVVPWYNILVRAYLHRMHGGAEYLGQRILERADHVFLASETDTALISKIIATTLPNLPLSNDGGEIVRLSQSDAKSRILFAVGQWSKAQNSDGMSWFIENSWPLILRKVPEARLRIAGRVSDDLSKVWKRRKNLDLLGFIDDLTPEYEQAAAVVAPITWGGGTKIKVLEALAYGRVPVGTSHAFDGLADEPILNDVVVKSDDAEKLADGAVKLLCDHDFRSSQEIMTLKYYGDNYSISCFNEMVAETVKSVVLARP
ncbi:glycosyltransferase family 4 protein [Rhizobium sp. CC1099]|uniref:glycosyltransferase n=1 Tax=Rhizobium sp. CC1099 TaxID=3039160 RepID=UPI0024B0AEC7|nr:glycosyltransferase family 4 protein [Rhizobium sp. CC1099]WFU86117.1 glycosyltransferase family 4 protein [Rhizobium sp. CC1099]